MPPPSVPVHAIIPVPSTSGNPSFSSLQWTADGQLIVTTKTDIYVFTPSLGVAFDLQYAVHNPPSGDAVPAGDAASIGFFRTMIEVDKGLLHHWPVDCRGDATEYWAAVSLGSLDVSIRSVTVSPSGLTPHGRCVVAILNANFDLSMWYAVKNHLRGEWTKIEDLNAVLKGVRLEEERSLVTSTLQAQVTAISWSHQADFALDPKPPLDASILAVATRSMDLNFLRYCSQAIDSVPIQLCATRKIVTSALINHLAWSPWRPFAAKSDAASLAASSSDGSVLLITITQHIAPTDVNTSLYTQHQLTLLVEDEETLVCEPDGRTITCLSWIILSGGHAILFFGKPGMFCLWSSPTNGLPWSGLCTLHLFKQTTFTDTSVLHPISGICSVADMDALVVTLHDGSFNVIYNVSKAPSVNQADAHSAMLLSRQLTADMRALLDRIESSEGKNATKAPDTNTRRINGLVGFDHGSSAAWLQETTCPSDFSYRHDATRTSKLLIAEILGSSSSRSLSSYLIDLLENPARVWGHAPIALLRPVFFFLHAPGVAESYLPLLLPILDRLPASEWSFPPLTPYTGDITTELRNDIRNSLFNHLLGWSELFALRVQLAVAAFIVPRLADNQASTTIANLIQRLHAAISLRVLHTLIRHFMALLPVITASDVPFIMRVVIQSLLPGHPRHLAMQAQALADALISQLGPSENTPSLQGFQEACPACKAPIALDSIDGACCERGHTWSRCSITSFVLSTPAVRTCVGCARKALLPGTADVGPNRLPDATHSWVAEELLSALTACLFCGNSFVTLV